VFAPLPLVWSLLGGCSLGPPASPPGVGDRWSDTEVMEVAWWRELTWTVAATRRRAAEGEPTIDVWMLHNEEPDGSWADLSYGVVRVEGVGQEGFVSRGWVTRSPGLRLDLEVEGRGVGAVIRVGVRYGCPGGEAGKDVVFRVRADGLAKLDELHTVDPSVDCARSWTTRIASTEPVVLQTTVDGEVARYRYDGRNFRPQPTPPAAPGGR